MECLNLLQQIQDFDVIDLNIDAKQHLGTGHLEGQQWSLLHNSGLLTLILLPSEGCPLWVYSETPVIAGGTTGDGLTDEQKLSDEQRRDLLEIVEDRYERRSTIVTSQVPVDHWYDMIGNPTLADAILDRLVHNAYRIELTGESLRKQRPLPSDA